MRAGEGGEGRRRDDEEMRGGVGRKRRMGAGVQERERDEGLSEEARKGDKGGSSSKTKKSSIKKRRPPGVLFAIYLTGARLINNKLKIFNIII